MANGVWEQCKSRGYSNNLDSEDYTEGKDLVDAIEMAEDAIEMTGMVMEDEGKKLPKVSDYAMAYEKADKKVQDDSDRFDYTKGIIT